MSRILARAPGVEAIYARHTHPQSPSFVPGHSDLDLTVVLSDQAANDPEKTEAVADLLERRRLYYYYLNPQDARITSCGELARLTERPEPMEMLVSPSDWELLSGREVRRVEPQQLPAGRLPWHPEFNRWWAHILQDYLLISMPGLENQYHRVFYRGAIKQVAYFMVARGLTPPQGKSSGDQSLAEWVFGKDPTMRELLSGLQQRKFWEGEQQGVRESIFHELLMKSGDFFAEFSSDYATADRRIAVPEEEGLHIESYGLLASKLEGMSDLRSRLAGVLVYPMPYWYPYFYLVDLILPDGISVDELAVLTELLRRVFRRREFGVKGRHFAFTLVPEKVCQTSLAFRGTPFPFLTEHVERYGKMLFGPEKSTAQALVGREGLIEGCGMFLPYFAINLGRRVEHSARTLNFSQLAAVRLFLETDEIITDPTVIRVRHQQEFGSESPPSAVWDYLLRDKPGRQEKVLCRSAAARLKQELGKVESLLDVQESQRPSGADRESLRLCRS